MLKALGIMSNVITIDINPKWNFDPLTKNIHSVVGYSTDADTVSIVDRISRDILESRPGHVLVMLDSEHSEQNVLDELKVYAKFVTLGSYLIVEDTNVNGHPSFPSHGAGPWEATEKFLDQHSEFQRDLDCQRFLLTFNPGGWLKRMR
jgi:cephalosporin hydroxylase